MTGQNALLDRRDAVATLLDDRGDLLVVTGLGGTCWDCTAAGDTPLNFPMWGGMGGAAMVGLGLSLAQPSRRVLVVTGDGEMLMGLGALATIATAQPNNLAIAVIDNERYGETGMQRTHTAAGVDIAGMATAAGFVQTWTVLDDSALAEFTRASRSVAGPLLGVIKVATDKVPLVMPPRDGALLKDRFREAVLGTAATN